MKIIFSTKVHRARSVKNGKSYVYGMVQVQSFLLKELAGKTVSVTVDSNGLPKTPKTPKTPKSRTVSEKHERKNPKSP